MSAYVPPHSRNKGGNGSRKPTWKVEEEKKESDRLSKLIPTESNFPTLSSGHVKPPTTWGGQKSFAVLANEWKEKSDEEKQAEEDERSRRNTVSHVIPTPRFYRMQPIENDYYDNDVVAENAQNSEDEWTVVSKKERVVKEITHEQLDKEYVEAQQENNETTMWNDQPRDHETYWDERRT
jgi:hypothetical protein